MEEILPFTSFFRLSIYALVAKIQSDKVVRWCPDGDFGDFSASYAQHVSDLHSKLALGRGPHHVSKYGRHPISDR